MKTFPIAYPFRMSFLCMWIILALSSCSTPNYLSSPNINYPIIENKITFGVQNMDNDAKVEQSALTAHYEGFDVKYHLLDNKDIIISMSIINNTNKSLIIDKSKCYVLYDGYSTQLFKDVRSSRSTTFNNVQDAINNVQTNESGVSMTIPPYSKWELEINETNIRGLKKTPRIRATPGTYNLGPFDDQENVEFVVPYTYDYSMAKWATCRNRIYISLIESKIENTPYKVAYEVFDKPVIRDITTTGFVKKQRGEPDYLEANRIDQINYEKYKKHLSSVHTSHIIWGIITLPTIIGPIWNWALFYDCMNSDHEPTFYGDKYTSKDISKLHKSVWY